MLCPADISRLARPHAAFDAAVAATPAIIPPLKLAPSKNKFFHRTQSGFHAEVPQTEACSGNLEVAKPHPSVEGASPSAVG
jgi:hypothetical protein